MIPAAEAYRARRSIVFRESGAWLFNIAAVEPFTPAQMLWIHFVVNAPFGFAPGSGKESLGLMDREPRPRGRAGADQAGDDRRDGGLGDYVFTRDCSPKS